MIRFYSPDDFHGDVEALISEKAADYYFRKVTWKLGQFYKVASCESYSDPSFIDLFMKMFSLAYTVPVDSLEPYRDKFAEIVESSNPLRDTPELRKYYERIRWDKLSENYYTLFFLPQEKIGFPIRLGNPVEFTKVWPLHFLTTFSVAVIGCILREVSENASESRTAVSVGSLSRYVYLQFMMHGGSYYTQYSSSFESILPDLVRRVSSELIDTYWLKINLTD